MQRQQPRRRRRRIEQNDIIQTGKFGSFLCNVVFSSEHGIGKLLMGDITSSNASWSSASKECDAAFRIKLDFIADFLANHRLAMETATATAAAVS